MNNACRILTLIVAVMPVTILCAAEAERRNILYFQ